MSTSEPSGKSNNEPLAEIEVGSSGLADDLGERSMELPPDFDDVRQPFSKKDSEGRPEDPESVA